MNVRRSVPKRFLVDRDLIPLLLRLQKRPKAEIREIVRVIQTLIATRHP